MDQISALIGRKKHKNNPELDIDNSEETKNEIDDELESLPIRPKKNIDKALELPRGRSQSVFELGVIVTQRDPSRNYVKQNSTSLDVSIPEHIDTGTLPNTFRRSNRRLRRLNTQLLEAIRNGDRHEAERILHLGANPNATCNLSNVSAYHLAALTGGETLRLLTNSGAEKKRVDRCGRTPLHLAAWAGNVAEIALLLDFPENLQAGIKDRFSFGIEEVTQLKEIKGKIDIRCDTRDQNMHFPKDWLDNVDHYCRELERSLPHIQSGWTALHSACANVKYQCVRLLLSIGSDPNTRDYVGRTPLDVVGFSYNKDEKIDQNDFIAIVKLLLNCDLKNSAIRGRKLFNTTLHKAVEMENLQVIMDLVNAGASVVCHDYNGLTPLHVCVNKKLKEHLQVLANNTFNNMGSYSPVVDAKDKHGQTVLHAAISAGWVAGVCVCLEAGATITAKDINGETPIHLAAALGNLDILNEILVVAKQGNLIDFPNAKGETALFKSVKHNHIDCVKKILKEGASIQHELQEKVNIFHIAAELGSFDILKILLDHDYTITRSQINFVTTDKVKGFGPIHYAVWNNHADCVKLLLTRNCFVSLETFGGAHMKLTPLHLAAIKNNVEIAKILYKFDKETIHNVDDMGWTPLHTASHHKSRHIIIFLLKQGADLSASTWGPNKMKKTCIEMIVDNICKPTDFLEEILDSYIIDNNNNLQDCKFEPTLEYKILFPKCDDANQMKVLQALVKTGNKYDQRRLLLHPLIESFLYFKWKGLVPFFYSTILLYTIFVMSLTIFVMSIYFVKDIDKMSIPKWLNVYCIVIVIYFSAFLLIIQECFHSSVSRSYYLRFETWIKFASIVFGVLLPNIVGQTTSKSHWPRHLATVTLLLSWFNMMFLLSRFPRWGFYVLMFKRVSCNVLKILLMFSFLLIGFSLCFMIEFHEKFPFENPLAAFTRIMVMMTSEFDYNSLIESIEPSSVSFVRILFLIFLVLTAIVVMNLMVGVAVNDLHNLQLQGNIQRLKMQVEFLTSLETLVHNKIFKKLIPRRLFRQLVVPERILMSEDSAMFKTFLPKHIREAILNTCQRHNRLSNTNVDVDYNCGNKSSEEYSNINQHTESIARNELIHKEADQHFKDWKVSVEEIRNEMKNYTQSINILERKFDEILNKLDSITK